MVVVPSASVTALRAAVRLPPSSAVPVTLSVPVASSSTLAMAAVGSLVNTVVPPSASVVVATTRRDWPTWL